MGVASLSFVTRNSIFFSNVFKKAFNHSYKNIQIFNILRNCEESRFYRTIISRFT